jgi:hypothetical protein
VEKEAHEKTKTQEKTEQKMIPTVISITTNPSLPYSTPNPLTYTHPSMHSPLGLHLLLHIYKGKGLMDYDVRFISLRSGRVLKMRSYPCCGVYNWTVCKNTLNRKTSTHVRSSISSNTLSCLPLFEAPGKTCQNFIVSFPAPITMLCPSGLIVEKSTLLVWSSRVVDFSRVWYLQMMI